MCQPIQLEYTKENTIFCTLLKSDSREILRKYFDVVDSQVSFKNKRPENPDVSLVQCVT